MKWRQVPGQVNLVQSRGDLLELICLWDAIINAISSEVLKLWHVVKNSEQYRRDRDRCDHRWNKELHDQLALE